MQGGAHRRAQRRKVGDALDPLEVRRRAPRAVAAQARERRALDLAAAARTPPAGCARSRTASPAPPARCAAKLPAPLERQREGLAVRSSAVSASSVRRAKNTTTRSTIGPVERVEGLRVVDAATDQRLVGRPPSEGPLHTRQDATGPRRAARRDGPSIFDEIAPMPRHGAKDAKLARLSAARRAGSGCGGGCGGGGKAANPSGASVSRLFDCEARVGQRVEPVADHQRARDRRRDSAYSPWPSFGMRDAPGLGEARRADAEADRALERLRRRCPARTSTAGSPRARSASRTGTRADRTRPSSRSSSRAPPARGASACAGPRRRTATAACRSRRPSAPASWPTPSSRSSRDRVQVGRVAEDLQLAEDLRVVACATGRACTAGRPGGTSRRSPCRRRSAPRRCARRGPGRRRARARCSVRPRSREHRHEALAVAAAAAVEPLRLARSRRRAARRRARTASTG